MRFFLFLLTFILLSVACQREMPTQKDGRLMLQIIAADTSGVLPVDPSLGYAPVPFAQVNLYSKYYYSTQGNPKRYSTLTDLLGRAAFENLPVSDYIITVSKDTTYTDPADTTSANVTLRGFSLSRLDKQADFIDSIKTQLRPNSPLVINEIYYCGPKNKAYYFYDQFIELYNSADTSVYLDGKILCRALQKHKPDMDRVDYVQVIYVYQFPGRPLTGRSYPLAPHKFAVIAQDAFDHSQNIATAVDLSHADWEFYNPFAGDIDNPDVPNVVNVIPENGTDFMINLVHNGVILADGSDYYNGEVSSSGYQYIHVPIRTILDGVEYSANPNKQKEITSRVDAGFAGVGIGKYSGKSVERRTPGFDTDNSSLDFVNINHPTPGYEHK